MVSLDPNTLYYTFSTISQTLAGAFGVMGAFVLYKKQSNDVKLQRSSERAWMELTTENDGAFSKRKTFQAENQLFGTLNLNSAWDKISKLFVNLDVGSHIPNSIQLKIFLNDLRQEVKVGRLLIKSLWLTALIICLCVIGLCFTSLLKENTFLFIASLLIVCIGFFATLITYINLIINCLEWSSIES